MTSAELTAKNNRELRDKLVARTEVLERVKTLFMVDGIELATTQQVADYYEVPVKTVQMCKLRNEEELASDGLRLWTLAELRSKALGDKKTNEMLVFETEPKALGGKKSKRDLLLNNERKPLGDKKSDPKSLLKTNPKLLLTDGTEIPIPRRGLLLWPRRAILRLGMLMHDGPVSRAIRDVLLDIEATVSNEQKITVVDNEIEWLKKMVEKQDGTINSMAQQIAALTEYINRNQIQLDEATATEKLSNTAQTLYVRLKAGGKHTDQQIIWATINQATGMNQAQNKALYRATTEKFKERTGTDLYRRVNSTYQKTGYKPTVISKLGGEEEASIYLDCAVEAIAEAGLLINEAAVMDMMDKKRK